jgi:hypothetical protein
VSDAVVHKTPSYTAESSCDHGVPDGHDGSQVGPECRASVEAKPPKPQHERAKNNQGNLDNIETLKIVWQYRQKSTDIVGSEIDQLSFAAASENPRISQTANTATDLDRTAA